MFAADNLKEVPLGSGASFDLRNRSMKMCWWHCVAWLWMCARTILAADAPAPDWIHRSIKPEQRQHWAYQPLRPVAVPVSDDATNLHPVDCFLAEAQRKANVTANPLVDRRRLLRRLTETLIGLPPTSDELQSFLVDDSPDAVERCVDRLLSSPHYGVRWGRHWLDVARFAESHGYEHDYDRLTAYHYRDFVTKAFNSDQPFDEFARWQIAGDRLAPDNRFAWMATGFLAAGPHSTQITKREAERQRYYELDDMVSTLGLAFLGLNLNCARCHDHPYDPLPQGDYYRLAAFFTKTVRSDVEFDFDPEGYRRSLVAFEQEQARLRDRVTQYEHGTLRTVYRTWRQQSPREEWQVTWQMPESVKITSGGESQWRAMEDGSWLVMSPALERDHYDVDLKPRSSRVTSLRLETLTDATMTHGGPGRAEDGTFFLSGVTLFQRRRDEPSVPVVITKVAATFEQVDSPAAGVLDQSAETAWGIDPQLGRRHALVLHQAEPLHLQDGDELRLSLDFATRPQAAIGRVRVAFSAETNPSIKTEELPIPERVALALQQKPADINPQDWPAVARWFGPRDAEWQRLDAQRQDHAATAPKPRLKSVLVATEGRPAIRLHTQAVDEYLPETHYLHRGDPERALGVALPDVLQVFPAEIEGPRDRVALAKWLTDVEHGAGALVARVCVNRLWQQHFGTGLVATPDDFGTRGDPPVHPELLDWLAGELIRHDWQLKPIQRLLVTSAAFQRTSFPTEEAITSDPNNQTLWRWTPRPRDAESLRDAILCASNQLDDRLDGPSEREPEHHRRASYTFIKRSAPDHWLTSFDAPDGCRVVGRRERSVTARQALTLWNSPLVLAAAERLAKEVDTIAGVYQRALQRDPTPEEIRRATSFLHEHTGEAGWVDFCQVVLCLDEFVFLD